MTALLPVFFMEGLSGAFSQPLAQAYVVATLVSPIIALTVTPALVLILLSNAPIRERMSPILAPLHHWYEWLLSGTLKVPSMAYLATVALLVGGIYIWPLMGQELLPSFKERDFLMHWLGKPGTGHEEMMRSSVLACNELRSIEGVRNCGTHIGQALLMDEVYGIYFAEHWISVDPSVDYDETLAKVQATVDGYVGFYTDVQTYLKERIREVLTGSSHPVVIRLYGEDLNILRAKAAEIEEQLLQIEALHDQHVEYLVDIPQIQIKVDLDKAQTVGIKPGDVRRTAAYLMAGEEAAEAGQIGFDIDLYLEGGIYFELYSTVCYPTIESDPLEGLSTVQSRLAGLVKSGVWLEEVAVDDENSLILVLAQRKKQQLYLLIGAWTVGEWDELPEE